MKHTFLFLVLLTAIVSGCVQQKPEQAKATTPLTPDYVTDPTLEDSDDPAIWINIKNPAESLILGTDKGDTNGGIYVFDLKGRCRKDKTILHLLRPNNIDVEYGFILGTDTIDIAVFSQRNGNNLRVLRLPDMTFIDGGGINVFAGEKERNPMGIALYKKPASGSIYAVVSRKSGPDGSYLWQYILKDSAGIVTAEPVRKFGAFQGGKEIESIAVDDELGYVYYSDEGNGVYQYHADPDSSNTRLDLFAQDDFAEDHEGISIYKTSKTEGYILVSDQQANRFHVFTRASPHKRLAIIPLSTTQSDGSEVTNVAISPLFPSGFFVAMADDRTFQIYSWEKLLKYLPASR